MKEQISFSIIIPVHNTSLDRVQRCIESIKKQTYENYNAFIVDDGSEEQYSKQLKGYIASCGGKFNYYRQENAGAAEARNTGIKLADNEHLMFVDADDVISPYILQHSEESIRRFGADFIIGLVHKISEKEYDQKTNISSTVEPQLMRTQTDKEDLICAMVGEYQSRFYYQTGYLSDGPIAKVVKSDLAKSCLFDREDIWNEDTIWNVKLLKKCSKPVVCGEVWYEYLVNSSSLTRSYRSNMREEFKKAISKDIKLIDEMWPSCKNRLYITMVWNMSYVSRMYLYNPSSGFTTKDSFREFKKFLHYPDYKYVLKNVDFSNDHRFVHRLEKEMLRFFSLHEPHYIAFLIWKLFTRQHQSN